MIYSVIVCYEPTEDIFVLISSLIKQNVYPIIIDNSENNYLDFDTINCVYKRLGENVGIAQAQNIGIDLALAQGAEAIVFFDQDSTISDDLISRLYDPIKLCKTVISVPIYRNLDGNFFYQIVKCNRLGWRKKIIPHTEMSNFHTNIAISSGSMIKSELFNIVGKMDTDLFIDHVDTEWFLRASDKGYNALVITNAVMNHTIGDNLLNLRFMKIPIHSPARRYYRVRNSFKLLTYAHVPKLLAIRESVFSIIHQILIVIYCPNKSDYMKFFFKAVKDFLKGNVGKIDS